MYAYVYVMCARNIFKSKSYAQVRTIMFIRSDRTIEDREVCDSISVNLLAYCSLLNLFNRP